MTWAGGGVKKNSWRITYSVNVVQSQAARTMVRNQIPNNVLFLTLDSIIHLQAADGTLIERPECPAYWSLDPAGTPRLSPDEASRLGFPALKWRSRVYAGLRQFHAAKGFAPTLYRRQMVWSMDEYFEGPLPG
ncbi:hypothetical protein B0H14DRAFT_2584898 [Mycena olivaceomarginata]|nr:hypothetical protein B0H14DRAFT_2584898 [Mycena olivaceomarginata]